MVGTLVPFMIEMVLVRISEIVFDMGSFWSDETRREEGRMDQMGWKES